MDARIVTDARGQQYRIVEFPSLRARPGMIWVEFRPDPETRAGSDPVEVPAHYRQIADAEILAYVAAPSPER